MKIQKQLRDTFRMKKWVKNEKGKRKQQIVTGEASYYSILHSHPPSVPAMTLSNGSKYWYKMGVQHREGGPAVITNTSEYWMIDGAFHRDDGPASIRKDERTGKIIQEVWYQHGKKHRADGPAVIDYVNNIKEYWVNGEQVDSL